jgi:hypothetical protein
MATYRIPRDPLTWFVMGARRVLLSACTVALVSCGGGKSGPAPPADSVNPAGADTPDGAGIALNPPTRVGESNRIEVTWQAQGDLTSFTVLVQRSAGLGFEAVDATTVDSNSAQFARGAVYRLDFPTARVLVRGCGASNQCVDSNAQTLVDVLLTGVAQLAPAIQTNRLFGHSIALSADGNTLAAASSENDSNQPGQGTIRIFQRGDDGRWVQEARLERFSIEASFGPPLALSGDGQTLVVGAYDHTGTVGGINAPEASAPPAPPGQNVEWTGAIHVFMRDRQQRQWGRQAFIKAAVPVAGEALGFRVAVSHDGHRALAAAFSRMYLFERTNGQWRQARIFDSSSGAIDPSVGMALSADGRSIAVKEGAILPEPLPQSVTVYKECQCSEGWRPVAKLSSARPPPDIRFPNDGDEYGRSLSFSGDGNVLAVGAPMDAGDEACDGTTLNTAAPAAGAVYVFAADGSGVWQRRAFLKARTALRLDQLGGEVALSGDGKVLAAKACGLAANAQGLRRNHRAGDSIGQLPGDSPCSTFAGASYVFEESPAGAWSHTAAAIPAAGELVGFDFFSLALSADGQTLGMGLTSFSSGGQSSRARVY